MLSHISDNVRVRRGLIVVVPSLCTAGAYAVLAHFHLVGDLPLWALLLLLGVITGTSSATARLVTPCASAWALAVGVGLPIASVTVMNYAIGWGPTLAVGYVFVASRAIDDAGVRTRWFSAAWLVVGVAAGQVAIAAGIVPSYVPQPYVHGLAALGVLGTIFVIKVLADKAADNERIRTALEAEIHDRARADQGQREALSLLTATLDSTADGILVVDETTQVSHFNSHFLEMWGVTADVVPDSSQCLPLLMAQLARPEEFVAKFEEIYAAGDVESYDTLELKDGRVFERYSRPQRVDGKVVGRVWSFRDVTARTQLELKLVHQAFHDSLTGLANNALFRDRLEHAVARVDRSGAGLAVLFLDVDNFKTVNDSLGHAAGDSLLVHVGEVLVGNVRSSDTVARLGGDEFAVLMEDVREPALAIGLADRIVAAMRAPVAIDGNEVGTTVSVGVTFHEPGADGEDLVRNADLAMYSAKQLGKDRHVEYEGELYGAIRERLALENDLHAALQDGQLAVHFQPIIDLVTRRLAGFEALVRWQHPARGLLRPDIFLPIAEEAGLIEQVDRYVLIEAARQVATWALDGALISVNMSARRLLDPQLISDVAAVIRVLEGSAHLVLEVTESAMLRDTDTAIAHLRAARALGAKIALDDFGTGYSSLAHLHQLPIDIVKIDQSFVRDLAGQGDGDRGVAKAIVQLARSMDLVSIAEGVESAEHLEALLRFGCPLAQGAYLGEPVDGASARQMAGGQRIDAGPRPRAVVGARGRA